MTMAAWKTGFEANQPYKMSFTSGGLFLNECIDLAASYLETRDWDVTISQLQADGLTSSPKQKSKRRILRELVNRLETLTDDEVRFLVERGDRQDQSLLIWLSFCRAYRLVREFTLEIVQDRYLAYQLDLSTDSFDLFFEHKAEWEDTLASTSASTRVRLRQVVFKTMREVGIISEENRIQSSYLSPQLRGMIEATNPADLAVFPGVVIEGGLS